MQQRGCYRVKFLTMRWNRVKATAYTETATLEKVKTPGTSVLGILQHLITKNGKASALAHELRAILGEIKAWGKCKIARNLPGLPPKITQYEHASIPQLSIFRVGVLWWLW